MNAIAVLLVLSGLDYCNSCMWDTPKNQLLRLQRVKITAARTVAQTKRSDQITPILHDLHWLPVEKRIDYKIQSLVYSCMNGTNPPVPLGINTSLHSSAPSAVLHPIWSLHPQC